MDFFFINGQFWPKNGKTIHHTHIIVKYCFFLAKCLSTKNEVKVTWYWQTDVCMSPISAGNLFTILAAPLKPSQDCLPCLWHSLYADMPVPQLSPYSCSKVIGVHMECTLKYLWTESWGVYSPNRLCDSQSVRVTLKMYYNIYRKRR